MKNWGILLLLVMMCLLLLCCESDSEGETKTYYVNDGNDDDTSSPDDDDNDTVEDSCYFDPGNCLELTNYIYGTCGYDCLRLGEDDYQLMYQSMFKTLCDRILSTQLHTCLWEKYQTVKDLDDGFNGCTFFDEQLVECLSGEST